MSIIEYIRENFPEFWKKHKLISTIISTAIISIGITWWVSNQVKVNPLVEKVDTLKEKNTDLQQQLLPFKIKAFDKFPNLSESDAMGQLAERISQLETNLISMFDYQEVSTWSFLGSIIKEVGSMTSSADSPVIDWSKGYVILTNSGQIQSLKCDGDALEHYIYLIQKFDLYPFPYYVLALCQKEDNRPEWQASMGQALKILSKTTLIPNHNKDHDAVLNMITRVK